MLDDSLTFIISERYFHFDINLYPLIHLLVKCSYKTAIQCCTYRNRCLLTWAMLP